MKKEMIFQLTENFENFSHKTDDGVEFWLARDLQHLLNYSQWRNFVLVIAKAKTACELSGQNIDDHFADISKTIKMLNINPHEWINYNSRCIDSSGDSESLAGCHRKPKPIGSQSFVFDNLLLKIST